MCIRDRDKEHDELNPYIPDPKPGILPGELEEKEYFLHFFELNKKKIAPVSYTHLSNWYFRLNLLERAYSSIIEALQKEPENLAALNLLGSIYEAENKIPEALKVYTKVLELAEEQGAETMIPIARIKIGMLQFRLPLDIPCLLYTSRCV